MTSLDLTRARVVAGPRSLLVLSIVALIALLVVADRSMTALAGTLASEDLTCITAGQLVRLGKLDAPRAVFGCLAGIYLGDLGLWCIGRAMGRPRWIGRWVREADLDRFGEWFDRNAGAAILG